MGIIISKKSSENTSSSASVTSSTRPSSIVRSQSENDKMSRKIWWSPKRNVVAIHNDPVKFENVRPKVGSLANIEYRSSVGQAEMRNEPIKLQASPRIDSLSNKNWSPSTPNVSIQQNKLKWAAQPKINSMDNVNYKPTNRVPEIYDEKLNFKHVPPRVNCGFVD